MCVCLSLSFSEKSLFYAFTRARVTNVFKVFRLKILQKTRKREREDYEDKEDKEDKALIEAPTENEDDDDELREKEDRKPNDR